MDAALNFSLSPTSLRVSTKPTLCSDFAIRRRGIDVPRRFTASLLEARPDSRLDGRHSSLSCNAQPEGLELGTEKKKHRTRRRFCNKQSVRRSTRWFQHYTLRNPWVSFARRAGPENTSCTFLGTARSANLSAYALTYTTRERAVTARLERVFDL